MIAWQVVLGLPYSQKVDVWSLGCILAELLTSNVLFCNTSVQTLLAGQIGLAGEMPEYMIAEGRHAPRYFCGRRLYLRKPSGQGFFVSPRPRSLRETLGTDDELFLDFMTKMLRLDMNSRISAAEASVVARGLEPRARADRRWRHRVLTALAPSLSHGCAGLAAPMVHDGGTAQAGALQTRRARRRRAYRHADVRAQSGAAGTNGGKVPEPI